MLVLIICLGLFNIAFAENARDINLVVLFMENRAFDHIFGCAAKDLPGVDGIPENAGNWLDPNNHSKGFVKVQCGSANYVCKNGPEQSFKSQWFDYYGNETIVNSSGPYSAPDMSGFLNHSNGNVEVLSAFSPEQLPIKFTLAKEFGIFNKFYAAIPGPSQPNHMFAQSGTSCGVTETGITYWQCGGILPLFPQKTIYDKLSENGNSFSIYYNDTPGDIYITSVLEKALLHSHKYDEPEKGFYDAAKAGTLPNFSFIVPRYGGPHPNDDHPCHDVALGEELLKDVYENLRASPQWNKTALLVVYDDPGGFFDHVGPPIYAPPPDADCNQKNTGCPDKFNFDRLGMRLTSLLISPLIPKGTVIQDPVGPTNNSKYELTSIAATVKSVFGIPDFLTKRDAWAGDFSKELSLSEPRTDCPMTLPDAPEPTGISFHYDDDDDDDDDKGTPFDDDDDSDDRRNLKGNVVHFSGCLDPKKLTRRQKRQMKLYSTILEEELPEDVENFSRKQGDMWVYSALERVLTKVKDAAKNKN